MNNQIKKYVAQILTMICTCCLVLMKDPFCVFIFHKIEEPDGIDKWRKKRGK